MSNKKQETKTEEAEVVEITEDTGEEEITYSQAVEAIRTISPIKQVQGQMVRQKSDLSSIKGKIGLHVYHIKHDLKDACKVLDDKQEDLVEDINKLREKIQKMKEDNPEEEKELSKKDKEKLEELNKERDKLIDEINDLSQEKVTVTFKKGKLPISKIEDAVDSDTLEALDFAIDFDE